MAVSWDLNRGLAGMFGQWSQDRHKAIDDQAEFERQEKVQTANMRRDQEMYSWKSKREAEAQEKQLASDRARMTAAGYSEEEIVAHETGAGTSFGTKLDQESQLATAKTDATLAAQQRALDSKYKQMYPKMSDEERQTKVAQDLRRSQMTAAEKNNEAVQGILSKYKDQENPEISKVDKISLGIYGVQLPQDQKIELDGGDRTKIMDTSMKYAQEMYGDRDLVSDTEILNIYNSKAGEKGQTKDPQLARGRMIRQTAKNRYVFSINSITGTPPTSIPGGGEISEADAENSIVEVEREQKKPIGPTPEKRASALSNFNTDPRGVQNQRPVAPAPPMSSPGLQQTKPQAGSWRLPKEEEQQQTGLGGPPGMGTQDIINRMNQ